MPLQIRKKGMIYCALIIPFFLNDFSNIFIENYSIWLVLDYGMRFIVMGSLLYLINIGELRWDDLGFGPVKKDLILSNTLSFGLIAFLFSLFSYFYLAELPYNGLGKIPIARDHTVFILDKYFGLFLVALSEEVVFRGIAFSAFKEAGVCFAKTVLFSSLIFAAIHWSLSAEVLINAIVFGVILMGATRLSGSIIPAILIHFATNLILYR